MEPGANIGFFQWRGKIRSMRKNPGFNEFAREAKKNGMGNKTSLFLEYSTFNWFLCISNVFLGYFGNYTAKKWSPGPFLRGGGGILPKSPPLNSPLDGTSTLLPRQIRSQKKTIAKLFCPKLNVFFIYLFINYFEYGLKRKAPWNDWISIRRGNLFFKIFKTKITIIYFLWAFLDLFKYLETYWNCWIYFEVMNSLISIVG